MDGLAIGIELDIPAIGDSVWPAAAGCPDELQAAASSETAATPTAPRASEADRGRRRCEDLNMGRPPQVPG